MDKAIEIKGLKKSFGQVHAVNDLSFTVERGELFAFLGVNGAGKSTTISIMCGALEKDEGEIYINGKNIEKSSKEISGEIGVVFQNSVLDGVSSVKENLISRAALYGIFGKECENRINELAEVLDFKDILTRTVGKLSGGQRRRVDVARALIHKPELLILDEPTTGLDPQTRKTMWRVIEELRKQRGMTVFLTTHYMEEAADADRVIILESGKIAASGTPVGLKNEYAGDYITLYGADENDIKPLGVKYEKRGGAIRIEVANTACARDLIIRYPMIFTDFEIEKGKMDDVFLAVTGKRAGGDN